MYKVEKWVLEDITKVLDHITAPTGKDFSKWLASRRKNANKAKKLSKLIKDNYTEVQI
jgi:hypothetical protein